MTQSKQYYIIEASFLPEIINKVLQAKALLEEGHVQTITEAVHTLGISRSAFYKYQHAAKPFFKDEGKSSVTLGLNLLDYPGVLSDVLRILAQFHVNLLTINQTIPIQNVANVTLTFETLESTRNLDDLISVFEHHEFIKSVTILGREDYD